MYRVPRNRVHSCIVNRVPRPSTTIGPRTAPQHQNCTAYRVQFQLMVALVCHLAVSGYSLGGSWCLWLLLGRKSPNSSTLFDFSKKYYFSEAWANCPHTLWEYFAPYQSIPSASQMSTTIFLFSGYRLNHFQKYEVALGICF